MKKTRTFAGIDREYSLFHDASVLLQPVPYDGTSTWGKGADRGYLAFLEAAENMELYDIETDSEVYKKGIHMLGPIVEKSSPEKVYQAVLEKTSSLLEHNKLLTFIGGEHSISIGIIEAFHRKYPDLTVLQLDAHADLRKEYLGTSFNHACAMHQASAYTNLVQVGIRSMDESEKAYLNRAQCFFDEDIHKQSGWIDKSIALMTDQVYITIDLDVLNPAVMPATGTPEPGGLDWYDIINYLRRVFEERNVVGFDIVELSPVDGIASPQFLAAKLYYKLLSYKYYGSKR